MEVVMDGSQWVTEAAHPRGTLEQKGQVEGKIGHDWATNKLQINTRTALSNGVQDQSFPDPRVTPVVKLAKLISAALVMIAGILTFDLLILWIASGRVIERMPF
jgi:hypothetical protein